MENLDSNIYLQTNSLIRKIDQSFDEISKDQIDSLPKHQQLLFFGVREVILKVWVKFKKELWSL